MSDKRPIIPQASIPPRKKSSESTELRARTEFLDSILNDSLDIIIAVNQQRNIVEFNKAAQVAFGYCRDEILGTNINQLYADPEEGEKIAVQIRRDGKFSGRVSNRRKNGEVFICQISASVLHSEDGEIIGVVGNSRDITKELKAEKELKESEETARILLDSSDDSIVLLDSTGNIIDLNNAAVKALDAQRETLIGSSILDSLDAPESDILAELIEASLHSKIPAKYESTRQIRLLGDSKFKVNFINKLHPVLGDDQELVKLALFSSEESYDRSTKELNANKRHTGINDALFRTTIKQLPGIIWCVDRELCFTLSDGLGLIQLGHKPDLVVGKSLFELLEITDPEHEYIDMHRKALAGAIVNFETEVNNTNFTCSIVPLRDDREEIIGALGVAFNIDDRIRLERKLEKEKETYRELVENIDETIFSLDRDGRFTYISPAIEETLDYSPDEVIGKYFHGFLYENDQSLLEELFQAVLNGESIIHEMKLPRKHEGFRWVTISSKPFYTNGLISGISGIIRDISEHKEATTALYESQQKYLKLVEDLPAGIFSGTLGPEGRIVMANKTTASIMGFDSIEEIVGTLINDLYFDLSERKIVVKRLMSEGIVNNLEVRLRKKDGDPVWLLFSARIVRNEEQDLDYCTGVIIDISGQKAAEEELRISENRFENIAEGSDDWIWEIGANLRIRYSNSRVKDIIGYEPKEVIGRSLLDFMYEEEMASGQYSDDYSLLSDKIFAGHQIILKHKKGGKVFTESIGIPIFRRDRSFVGFQGLTKDISEIVKNKEKEEIQRQQLIQADKMISLGILVSGVAHEINNPNQFIMINIPLLRRAWEAAEPILESYFRENGNFQLGGIPYSEMKPKMPELFSGIYNGAQRIKNIVKNLKDYSREAHPEDKKKLSINDVIDSSLIILANLIKNSTNNLQTNLDSSIPPVMGNFQRLEQVIINLIQNACEALQNPEQGIEIKTENEPDEKLVMVFIKDEGYGIKKSNMKFILDPFYTSKRDSGGTGLGLSISAGIIEDHNGTIKFKSSAGKGTTITIALPAVVSDV